MRVNILGIRELYIENAHIQKSDGGIHIFKGYGESVFIPNHHVSSYYDNKHDDEIAIAVKMTKKQFALLETFIKNIGGVTNEFKENYLL